MLAGNKTSKSNDEFLTGNIGKLLFMFAFPAVLSWLVAELYNLVDSIFVGHAVGALGVGGISIAFPVQRFFTAIAMLVSIGTCTYVARTLGENDKEKINKIIPNALMILTVVVLVLAIAAFVFIDKLIIMLGSTENIFPYAKTYISIILVGVIFQGLATVMSYILTAFGNTRIVLVSNIVGIVFNTLICDLLTRVFHFGIAGVAVATVVSQTLAFVYVLHVFLKAKETLELKFVIKAEIKIIKTIVFIGFSTFIIEISDAIVSVILNVLLGAIGGDMPIVAIGLITKISMFLFITVIGISSAMQPIAAYNIGAGCKARVKKILDLAMIAATVSSTIVWVITMIFTKQFIGIFVSDIEIIEYTADAFRKVVMIFPILATYYVSIYYYQAKAMVKESFILSILRQLILFIPLAFIMVEIFGVVGAWYAYPVSDLLSFLIALVFMRKQHKVDKLEIEEEMILNSKSSNRIVTA
ncbi:MATE family efflux transporter [Clostridium cellulovorans]|uniref:Multidrug export protein MepA n=1 Tax=Clostridium cellulovorans (strain ATCC 35296 / DSM 3052 / OCM 3 / 743B) TaxID=573061 RepID=D9SR88_CLOC7|nr:MATE family efflux transporter [Clostridium cellulovorans]ADL50376.1 MATE efflux family protein [Clostridium cellulovorans 743B]